MHHLIEWIVNFFTIWPGSQGPGSAEKRKVTAGCLLTVLIFIGILAGIYFAVA